MIATTSITAIQSDRRYSQGTSDAVPYHSTTTASAAAPASLQVGLRLVLPQGWQRK